jgi:hypothetical protein
MRIDLVSDSGRIAGLDHIEVVDSVRWDRRKLIVEVVVAVAAPQEVGFEDWVVDTAASDLGFDSDLSLDLVIEIGPGGSVKRGISNCSDFQVGSSWCSDTRSCTETGSSTS